MSHSLDSIASTPRPGIARRRASRWILLPIVGLVCAASIAPSGAQCNAITVGQVIVDPPTFHSLGFSLPVESGDGDFDATVTVEYKQAGSGAWKPALPLMRVRQAPVPNQFAGSIMNLQPGTQYDVRFHLQDPDGCDQTITATAATRPEPRNEPVTPNAVTVSSLQALNNAIAAASPGDVITLADGLYVSGGSGGTVVDISNVQGTFDNPIVIRGESRQGTIIDGNDAEKRLVRVDDSQHVHIEDLTLRRASSTENGKGMSIVGTSSNIVVQRVVIRDVLIGIWAKGNLSSMTICDNDLQGAVPFGESDGWTWDWEGIVLVGQGNVICHNTLAGFGDALGFKQPDEYAPSIGNDFFGNEVLWGGDDCFEFDYSERNNRFFRNRCSNTGNNVSFQPVYGGPAYVVQNIVFNAKKPVRLKLNEAGTGDPSGVLVYNNLFGLRFNNYSSRAYNVDIRNNLFVAKQLYNHVTDISTSLFWGASEPPRIDYNGWAYDGSFRFGRNWDTESNFANLQNGGLFEQNGRLLTEPIFANIATPHDVDDDAPTNDPSNPHSWSYIERPDTRLHPNSNAVDAGTYLPNINDGYSGSAPDLGPLELGSEPPVYGVRSFMPDPPDNTPPSVPLNLSATSNGQTRIDLGWSAAQDPDSGIWRYNVYRDDVLHDQANGLTYSDTGLAEGTTHEYRVAAVNGAGLESDLSAPASATTAADITRPTLVSADASGDKTRVEVEFSEPVSQAGAQTASNYTISGGVSVTAAALQGDQVTVVLTTSPHVEGVTYTLTVNNVADLASTPNPILPGSQIDFLSRASGDIDLRIASGGDDIEEASDGEVRSGSADLELAVNNGDPQTVGLRFTGLQIPQAATITAAWIQFKADETDSGATALLVEGQAADDAAPFGSVASRPRTNGSVAWSPPAWTSAGQAGPDQRTPDLASVVQEIVNRGGWQPGNAMVLMVTGSGTRAAVAYEGESTGAPLLHVEFVNAPPTEPPVAPVQLPLR